jgi:hypothetical protein
VDDFAVGTGVVIPAAFVSCATIEDVGLRPWYCEATMQVVSIAKVQRIGKFSLNLPMEVRPKCH